MNATNAETVVRGDSRKRLIVNADDFGISPGVNRGIIAAHEAGIVTSVSLMVRWPAAVEAAALGRAHPDLSVGLHIDLCEWIYRDEAWMPLYEVVPTDDAVGVRDEVLRQLEMFQLLLGKNPTHIDSHQHVHREEPVHAIVHEVADLLGVPLRHYTPYIGYRGDFYGQTGKGDPYPDALTVAHLVSILDALPSGITELGCHPGLGEDVDSMYCIERNTEVQVLCDPQVRATIRTSDIDLCSFCDIADARIRSSQSDA